MKIDVEIISQEMIKPSSPTTDHLQNYQLSFIDQIQPPVFMPLVMFYPEEHDVSNFERCNRIKTSLSEALSVYYPLAGRIKDNAVVDCNDEGVLFVEAKASCHLSEILENPDPNNHNKFIPLDLDVDDANELPAMAQVTYLECGGLVVSLGISHKVADALSFFMFLNCWAAKARGDTNIIAPKFESATLFPPKDISGFQPRTGITKENIVARRFVFDASAIAAIRGKYTDDIDARRPTRVEALSAFIWNRFMAVTQEKIDQGKLYTVIQTMNLRTRMDPLLSNHHFGNISRTAVAVPSMDKGDGVYDILNQMREAVRKVNGDYVKQQLQDGDGHLNFIKTRAASVVKGEVVGFSFTSLCRFPVYVADFGWGKPVWLGSARLTFKNLCCFFDTKYGDGIEAWINLKEEDMAKLEADKEFLSYVSPTPSSNVETSGI